MYIHQYIDNASNMEIDGDDIRIIQKTDYPWDENINVELALQGEKEFTLAFRIPGWCKNPQIYINDQVVDLYSNMENGYAMLSRSWKDGDVIQILLPMEVLKMRSNPSVKGEYWKSCSSMWTYNLLFRRGGQWL